MFFGTLTYFSVGSRKSPEIDLFIFRPQSKKMSNDIPMIVGRVLMALSLTVGIALNLYPVKVMTLEWFDR